MSCDITVEGNLGSDPEVKFLQSGEQITELRIAATPSKKNQQGQREDIGDPLWITASFWGNQNSYLADTLKKGDKVTVTGVLVQRGWEGPDGTRKTNLEVRYPRFKGVIPRRKQQSGFNAPKGGQQGDPWATRGVPF